MRSGLRANSESVRAYHDRYQRRKFGQQLKHADAIGADYAVIVGAQEVAAGMVTLQDMQTGEQEMIGLDDAFLRIMGCREGEDRPISRGGSAVLDLP